MSTKIDGITLKAAGYVIPKKDEAKNCCGACTEDSEGDGKRYASIYGNTKEMPIDLSNIKAGDTAILVCKVKFTEITTTDREPKDEAKNRFNCDILEVGMKKVSGKTPKEMSDAELNSEIDS
jgi:hypothetical protein